MQTRTSLCDDERMLKTQPAHPVASPWTFGLHDRLDKALTVAGVSNSEMAEYLGISSNTIGNYTSGRTAPKTQTLRLWAMRTGAPLEWLITGIEPAQKDPASEETGSEIVHPLGLEPRTHWIRDGRKTKPARPRNRADRSTGPKGRAR